MQPAPLEPWSEARAQEWSTVRRGLGNLEGREANVPIEVAPGRQRAVPQGMGWWWELSSQSHSSGGMGTSAQFSKWWGREVCSGVTITGKDGQFQSAGIWGPRGNDGDPYVTGGGETRTASWAQIMTPASRGMGLKHPQRPILAAFPA